ncbi:MULTISPECIES: hypothetical protein [unclassified Pseudomonas]|uniref:hypothetical protein n=1 Tax=unclassified Pseudomonas TaxID=196821 RepID=UPI000BD7FD1A|nr:MULTISPECIES: hypothetical protein [unclassified Pseudomonas]PVZ20279.1 hypothetical protein F474_00875 [Pseudomonas sp. URIL14HWK12:I12]PVZ27345.1 hypothetical protein F470_00530 [Pseudomonas sp. URIL14HWK12:I10]PVZ38234.1 hypothetical protein F472_00875 [Pseudomonas sp. URIL14HWK12:I11]SNZ04159.1 hypothetical protein SAMN05660463_00529 [Pseudomonas sp. URIL14HWK12:I9]
MLAHTLLFALAVSTSATAFSSNPQNTLDADITTLARQTADNASSFEWQQLWQQARSSGRFRASGAQPRFTAPQRQLPALARQVLAEPDRIVRRHPAGATLRRDFSPLVVGLVGDQSATGLCLTLSWRQPAAASLSQGPEPLQQATLSGIEPC